MVGKFGSNELVSLGHGFAHQSKHQTIHGAKIVNVGRIVELLVELDKEWQLLIVLGATWQAVPDKTVTKSERRGGDSIGQRGVDGGVVVTLISGWLELKLEDVDDRLAKDDR